MTYNHIILIIALEIILGATLIYFLRKFDAAVISLNKKVFFLKKDLVKILRYTRYELSQIISIFSSPIFCENDCKNFINILFLFSGGSNKVYKTATFIYKIVRELDKMKKQCYN